MKLQLIVMMLMGYSAAQSFVPANAVGQPKAPDHKMPPKTPDNTVDEEERRIVDAFGRSVTPDPQVPDNCEFYCTRYDITVCATNHYCLQRFVSECEMASYNCRHPQQPFGVVEDWRCEEREANLCTRDDWRRLL